MVSLLGNLPACVRHTARRDLRFRLTTHGKAVHSSQPWLGENAILKMHYCMDRLLTSLRLPPSTPPT